MSDDIILRRQISEELAEIEARRQELVGRLRKIDEVEEKAKHKEQVLSGRTNAHGHSWRSDDTCSYCGSMTTAKTIELLKTPGTNYSGADWKYGWPHKFYLGNKKFYNEHLLDASPEEFAEFNKISEVLMGIKWLLDDKGLGYVAVKGIQRWGVVGDEASKGAGRHSLDA